MNDLKKIWMTTYFLLSPFKKSHNTRWKKTKKQKKKTQNPKSTKPKPKKQNQTPNQQYPFR